ncbi:MAG: MFS transporter [Alphaproteobacteria bacterium]|nr:MFS transporter [Alphaproteobacteria bacterium]
MTTPISDAGPAPKWALGKIVTATVAVQVTIVMASLTIPVLASLIFASAGIPPYLVGYYSSTVYGCAAATSLATPRLLRHSGAIRLHQIMLLMTVAALLVLLPAIPAGFGVSALILGLAYGPMNPASTVLMARYTPPALRSRIFSLKQTAVPAGGALAGALAPILAAATGWRGTLLVIAVMCVVLALLIEPWRGQLDRNPPPQPGRLDTRFWLPARVLLRYPGLRAVGAASFAFGAIQFSFSAVFTTVLASIGWSLKSAGIILATALAVGVVCRIPWGGVADRVGSRPILGLLGLMMSVAAFTGAFLSAAWPGIAVVGLATLFGLSAYCWAGIGLAETVRQAPPGMISEASAGTIALTFLGALAGPALFSTATALTGSFRPAFILLGMICLWPSVALLRRQPVTG